MDDPQDVGPEAAARMLAEGVMLLDVREPYEWAAGHVEGAVHVPLADLTLEHVPAGTRVVVVCRVGSRSASVATALRRNGYDAVNLAGGMYAWAGADLPFVDATGAPGEIV